MLENTEFRMLTRCDSSKALAIIKDLPIGPPRLGNDDDDSEREVAQRPAS